MVRQVVEQGQWNNENSRVHTAVVIVHPWAVSRALSAPRSPISTSDPVDR